MAEPLHPGEFIRHDVIPQNMTIADAAKLIGVGRSALSNLLNGRAALSVEMAERVARAFGCDAAMLLDMQATFDAHRARQKGAASASRAYVPPFMQFKARDIQSWAAAIEARSRLAVLIRVLVNSTAKGLVRVDFPGNDAAEQPGWDGYTEATEATPWTPAGKSGWEFGVASDVDRKASSDFDKRVNQLSQVDRGAVNFVFVTPQSWPHKAAWLQARRAEKKWAGVYAFDASDLEQWLEQSIPGQAWFAAETKVDADGVLSLNACWEGFKADCKPALVEALFEEAVNASLLATTTRLKAQEKRPLIVTADSVDEALAFLHCLFGPANTELSRLRDQVVVFTKPGPLSRLASKAAPFIAVAAHRDVEKELAPYSADLASFVVYPRNAISSDPDISSQPLSYEAFERAMSLMGCNRDEVQRLSHESGRSLTILRRRLSGNEAIRDPDWARSPQSAVDLVPFMLAGAWRETNPADQSILRALAGGLEPAELERRLNAMLPLDGSPVWSIGEFRGVVSKVDLLFAIARSITRADLERFIQVAANVLSEDDPALDLPQDERWAAAIHGKKREISSALRSGIAETLVLFAVHGDLLLRTRTGFPVEAHVKRLIENLLTPLTSRKLEAQSNDLPTYAEAAPEEFLDIIEDDLRSKEPAALDLMRPASTGLFGSCPRTGLLWALESLAWSSEQLPRVVLVLGRLSERAIDDNWANKPSGSLGAIFHHWMPQTAAGLDERKRALELLITRFPRVAWEICIEQIDGSLTTGHYSHKPRWRTDGHGKGEPKGGDEAREFVLYTLNRVLDWRSYDKEMIGELIGCLRRLEIKRQREVWMIVRTWSEAASDEDKAWLREKIRVSVFTRRIARRKGALQADAVKVARETFDFLTPADVVLRHAWLFEKQWVEESVDELEDENLDFRARDERVHRQRTEAMLEVLAERGLPGILALAERGQAANVLGWLLPKVRSGDELVRDLIQLLNSEHIQNSVALKSLAAGALSGLDENQAESLLERIAAGVVEVRAPEAFKLFPFRQATWSLLAERGADAELEYWSKVYPSWSRQTREEFSFAIKKLVGVKRPRAAFNLLHLDFDQVEPSQLFDLMSAIVSDSEEPTKTFQLDRHDVRRAFAALNKSGELPEAAMAGLELQFIDALDDEDEDRLPNLERHIEKNPGLFIQAIAFAYKRDDDREDPPEYRVDDPAERGARAMNAYKLLQSLKRIPGRDRHGRQTSEQIEAWVEKVRDGCMELARSNVGDSCLGKLFSTAPVGEDGVWPIKPVRDALENIATASLSEGVVIGLMNARGAHWRGAGGEDERKLALKYDLYADALRYTHPRVARMMSEIAANYRSEAHWQDSDADVRKRLRN